ncbi:Domain of unknown function DUF1524 [Candidatus Nanopelagicaceae bacterium]
MKKILLVLALLSGFLYPNSIASAADGILIVAADHSEGYDRNLFKHWIDEDKNGCDTRAEVLISEATVKPKVGKKCALIGGKWVSTYDGKTLTKASQLDVDHLVPLSEAWRSGAWNWTAAQRQQYANDLSDKRSLIAVSLNSNRSKGDKDPASWLPKLDQCIYISNWVVTKWRFSLTYDLKEKAEVVRISQECFGDTEFSMLAQIPKVFAGAAQADKPSLPIIPTPLINYTPENRPIQANQTVPIEVTVPSIEGFDSKVMLLYLVDLKSANGDRQRLNCSFFYADGKYGNLGDFENYIPLAPVKLTCTGVAERTAEYQLQIVPKKESLKDFSNSRSISPLVAFKPSANTTEPTPTPTQSAAAASISPGAFCAPAGATGKSANGTSYTCKTSSTDTRTRWRQ